MFPIRKILCPTDFSVASRNALDVAETMARQFDAVLVVLHVVEPPPVMVAEGLLMYPAQHEPEAMRECLAKVRLGDPDIVLEREFAEGDTATEILRIAADRNCDLIVLGTHGRTGLGRLLMGSVAEQVIRRASCPVLSVKPQLAAVEANLPEAMAADLP